MRRSVGRESAIPTPPGSRIEACSLELLPFRSAISRWRDLAGRQSGVAALRPVGKRASCCSRCYILILPSKRRCGPRWLFLPRQNRLASRASSQMSLLWLGAQGRFVVSYDSGIGSTSVEGSGAVLPRGTSGTQDANSGGSLCRPALVSNLERLGSGVMYQHGI